MLNLINKQSGPSILFLLEYFDIIQDVVVDSMHACWEGVVKQFLSYWFHSENSEHPFYVKDKNFFEKQLLSVKFPHDFSHPVRSYATFGAYWKGKALHNNLVTKA